jgi:uncharacterized protein YndB with AHSA1/START domain
MADQAPPSDELEFTRIFDAPRELVFRCLIQPDHLVHFWGPAGTHAPIEHIHIDPRPGGVFETLMVNDADGSTYPTRATYDEVEEPARLVWTEAHSAVRVTLTLTELNGGRTRVHIHESNVPEAMRHPEAQAGFLTSLDRFAAYVRLVARGRDS